MRIRTVFLRVAAAVLIVAGTAGAVIGVQASDNSGVVAAASSNSYVAGPQLVMWQGAESQLRELDYRLVSKEETFLTDSRSVHSSTWMKMGEPTVKLTDGYPAEPGVFRVDTISFASTPGYVEFWCSNRDPAVLDFNVDSSINAAKAERAEVIAGTDKPGRDDTTGYDGVEGYSSCWMK